MVFSLPWAIWRHRRALAGAAFAAGALLTAGCGTATIDEALPGARNTGVYPNLNVPQQAATEQLTDEEAAAAIASVSAARAGQQRAGSGAAVNDVERLRRLRESHGQTTLDDIEE